MFISTVKNSNIILNPLKNANKEKNNKKFKTFLIHDNNKNIIIPKNNSNKELKSEIGFYPKCSEKYYKNMKKNNSAEGCGVGKEIFIQKLKDMIFSPGDTNYIGNENELQNNYYEGYKILKSSNKTKSSDKIVDLRIKENGSTNNYKSKYLYNININNTNSINNQINLLPTKLDNKKTLVLDLDETLIHSAFEPFIPKDDMKLNIRIKEQEYLIHVLKRPFLDHFLKIVSQKYEIIIFTASISDYANPLLDKLDPLKRISYRLFREHCTKTNNGLFIKDLNKLGRQLKDVIIIDNNPISYILNKMNGLPILTWHSIQSDNELMKLIPLLLYLTNIDDVRLIINKVVNGYYINYKEVNKIIKNNSSNNRDEDDYFENWIIPRKDNNIKNNNNNDEKYNKQFQQKSENLIKDLDSQSKDNVKNIIKYKGLLGNGDKFNFDTYKKLHHSKILPRFLEYDIDSNNNKDIDLKNHINLEINKKYLYMNNLNNNSNIMKNKIFENRRNNSSKNLIKMKIKVDNENNNSSSEYFIKDITPIKYNNNKEKISNLNHNINYLNNSKLNITDTNINVNHKKTMNDNTNIINNNFYIINNQSSLSNYGNNTIEYSSRNILNNNKPIYKYGYQSANLFFYKKERAESSKNNQKKHILSDLIDNLINFNKNNKKRNIDSNQLLTVSNNYKYSNWENIKNTQDIVTNLILDNIRTGRGLYKKYNSRSIEKINMEEENNHIIKDFYL